MAENEQSFPVRFYMVPMCELLTNPEWLIQFESLVRQFHSVACRVAKSHNLPEYPLWFEASTLNNAFCWLAAHIWKVVEISRTRKDPVVVYGLEEKILRAYQWAGSLVDVSTLKAIPEGQNPATLPDRSWIPTQPELEAWQGILDLLSHFDFQSSLSTQESPADELEPEREQPEIRPRWNSDTLTLSFNEVCCRHYTRRNAPNQFKLLTAFQVAGWPHAIDSPFDLDRTLRETKDGLNVGLNQHSPIRFAVEDRKPTWFKTPGPDCSG